MIFSLNAEGPAFRNKVGKYEPEMGIADVLEDIAAQLRSGTKAVDLHGERLRAWNGDHVGVVMISTYELPAK